MSWAHSNFKGDTHCVRQTSCYNIITTLYIAKLSITQDRVVTFWVIMLNLCSIIWGLLGVQKDFNSWTSTGKVLILGSLNSVGLTRDGLTQRTSCREELYVLGVGGKVLCVHAGVRRRRWWPHSSAVIPCCLRVYPWKFGSSVGSGDRKP